MGAIYDKVEKLGKITSLADAKLEIFLLTWLAMAKHALETNTPLLPLEDYLGAVGSHLATMAETLRTGSRGLKVNDKAVKPAHRAQLIGEYLEGVATSKAQQEVTAHVLARLDAPIKASAKDESKANTLQEAVITLDKDVLELALGVLAVPSLSDLDPGTGLMMVSSGVNFPDLTCVALQICNGKAAKDDKPGTPPYVEACLGRNGRCLGTAAPKTGTPLGSYTFEHDMCSYRLVVKAAEETTS